MLNLHYAKGTIAAASALALNEVGASYSAVAVDFGAGEQRGAAYLALNPKGRVPALVTDHGIITETIAILEFIAATHPHANLVPNDPYEAAQMRSVMACIASTMHVNHAHKLRAARWADTQAAWEDMRAKVPHTMTECCAYLEVNVALGPFVMGDRLTLADPYLYVLTTWLAGDGVNIADFPKLAAFQRQMQDRPSALQAREDGIL